MLRPYFLVIDPEHSGAISTRKLILESAKLNVITAYSADEALATMEKFPRVDGVVMDILTPGVECEHLVRQLRAINGSLVIIAVCSPRSQKRCEGADHVIDSFEPKVLLNIVESVRPSETGVLREHDIDMAEREGRC